MTSQLICSFIGALLLSSAWAKKRHPDAFVEIVRSYPLPSYLKTRAWALSVLLTESLLGLALLSGQDRVVDGGLWGAIIFIFAATCAVLARLARGERRFPCGCGGNLSEAQNATLLLVRNLLLLVILATAVVTAEERSLVWSWSTLSGHLTGIGMALGAKLVGAIFRSWEFIREWKVSG